MRGFLTFVILVVVVFFAVGETHGWYLGIPSHTPVFVYKMTATGQASRQAFTAEAIPVLVSGSVRHGSVEVKVIFQRPESVQKNMPAGPQDTIFDRTYQTGDRIAIDQTFKAGQGDYTVVLQFNDATGLFRLRLPNENLL
jgi:hypothetical protein